MVILCTSRRLGDPRASQLTNQEVFSGLTRRGLAGDNVPAPWAASRVIILGMGAYAVEHVRTAFEHGAARVRVLCRRHGLVCPQIIDYMN